MRRHRELAGQRFSIEGAELPGGQPIA